MSYLYRLETELKRVELEFTRRVPYFTAFQMPWNGKGYEPFFRREKMLDIKFIRENQELVESAMRNRQAEVDVAGLIESDRQRRQLVTEVEELKAEKNQRSKEIGAVLRSGGDADAVKVAVREIGERISTLDEAVRELEETIREQLLYMPNVPSAETPVGSDEADNPVIRSHGEQKRFDFEPKPHWELGEALALFDLERGAKLSGSGFPLYIGAGARLERALIQFMLDMHTEKHGYVEVAPPYFCNAATMTGTGQLPKFAEDMYAMPEDGLYAIPTAEVPVTNMYAHEIIEQPLPIFHTAYTPCFRREAGAAGKDTRGLQRLHQFDKVELVKFTRPEDSAEEHERLTENAEAVLKALGLTFRVIELCTGDIGFSAQRCYDIELWAPGQQKWLEVSSCSNFGDYQARRANIRYRNEAGKVMFVHTLNGSGVALPRLVIALLENGQQADGSVELPEVLAPYLNGVTTLS
jgi:seryl-tRNA synthetase